MHSETPYDCLNAIGAPFVLGRQHIYHEPSLAMLESIELPSIALIPYRTGAQPSRTRLSELMRSLLSEKHLDEILAHETDLEDSLVKEARQLASRAYPAHQTTDRHTDSWIDHTARDELHRALVVLYQQHMLLPLESQLANQLHPLPCRVLHELEGPWERDMLRRAHKSFDMALQSLPEDATSFAAWYRDTAFSHPLYEHDLYTFLASEATRAQLEWFFRMESAGEAAFDDLVALAQVGTRGEVKMEMASNYWDEMGRGRSHAVHTHLFHHLIEGLDLAAPDASELPWQVLGGVNVMLWSCISRRNAFRAQGALGAVELLAPQRCTRVVHGAQRVGIRKKVVVYYGAHAIIDIGHAEGWLAHVVEPQVRECPESRAGIAEGLIVRADASLDYFDYCLVNARNIVA